MKRSGKKLLAALLCLAMVLTLLPMAAFARGRDEALPAVPAGQEAEQASRAELPANAPEPDGDADLAEGTITPDGAVADTWKQDPNTVAGDGTICTVEDGRLHLKSGTDNTNNGGAGLTGYPAIFVNETMNAALAASNAEEKELSFDVECVGASVGTNPLFGIYLNYKSQTNASDSSKKDVFGKAICVDTSAAHWFWQTYCTNPPSPDWGDIASGSTAFTVSGKHHFELKWKDEAITSFKIDDTVLVSTEISMAPIVADIGQLDSVGFKVGNYGTSRGDFYISNLHYTNQATETVYDISGKVTSGGQNLAGVTVSTQGKTVTTDASGAYTITGLVNGAYTLTYTKEGYATATQSVTVNNADVTAQAVALVETDLIYIPTNGVNDTWTQVAGTKVTGSVDPALVDGKLVIQSAPSNLFNFASGTPAIFTDAAMDAALAATTGEKFLSFTVTPECVKEDNDAIPDYIAFAINLEYNGEVNAAARAYHVGFYNANADANSGTWFTQRYNGSDNPYGNISVPVVKGGVPINFEFRWTNDKVSMWVNGSEVSLYDGGARSDVATTNKVAISLGSKEFSDDTLQDKTRTTKLTFSEIHYSGQATTAARYVSGAVKCGQTAVEGATVSVAGTGNEVYTVTTDAAGAYRMAVPVSDTAYTLQATKDGYSTETKSVLVSESADKATLTNVAFSLTELPKITGKVVDKNNKPVRAAVSSDKRPAGSTVACAEDGTFTIIGAVAGEHTLTITAEGYETATKTVTVAAADVDAGTIQLADRVIPYYTLSTEDMDVRVARGFPQVIDYTMKKLLDANGQPKVMYGQTAELDTVKINGVDIKPTVTGVLDEATHKKVTYTMVIDGTNNGSTDVTATITAELRVGLNDLNDQTSASAGRTLGFYITGVEYAGADAAAKAANRLANPVDTIEIPNHSLVSVRSTQEGAGVTGGKQAANTTQTGDVTYPAAGNLDSAKSAYKEDFFAAFVYNDDLSAGLASNSAYAARGTAGDQCYPVRAQFEAKDGDTTTSIGLGSTLWYYDHDITRDEHGEDQKLTEAQLPRSKRIIAPLETPFAKVVIAGDENENGKVDWQDGAVAYRETVMHIPKGGEGVADMVNLRISMNFGSMATNPFLIALDNVKRVAANTDGLGQFVLLKGYAGEGHDSNHPQYGNIGIRMGGEEDFKTLLAEGGDLGATFGIHTNASEFYAEAIEDDNQVRRYTNGSLHYGWNWLDQGIAINGVYDYASGLRGARWDELAEIVGENPFVVYVDVWGNLTSGTENDFMTRALSEEIISHSNWRIAHEWAWANPYESTFQHWTTDFTYGDYSQKGKLSGSVIRFILNQYKDSFPPDFASYGGASNAPLLGGPAMQGFEGWQGDGEYDLSIYNTFNQMVYTKFLQHYPVVEWTNANSAVVIPYNSGGAGGSRSNATTSAWTPEAQIRLAGEGDEIVVTRGTNGKLVTDFGMDTVDKFLAGETEYRSRVVTLNGKVIVTGAPASAGEDNTFPKNKATLQYLIPWYWDVDGNRVTNVDDQKLYHWNAQGGQSTWELQDDWKDLANVMVYELSDQGRGAGKSVNVIDGKITLSGIKANTGYVITRGATKAVAPEIVYGEGLHLVDPSFSVDIPKGPWAVEGKGTAVRTTNSDGISLLKMVGEVAVSQEMTGLTAGTNYVTYVAVDNRSDAKVTMTITDSDGKVVATNYTQRSIARNYISSYYLHNGHGVESGGSYFQNMYLYFTPEASKTYTLTISREAGSGNAYVDDIRTVEYGHRDNKGTATSPVVYATDEEGNKTSTISRLTQNFENVPQGIWPFVVGPVENVADNRTHLSELNGKYSQAGWDVKKMDDVIDGKWSIKSNGLCGRNNLVYQTIPQNFRFEPDSVYTVEFDYELGSEGSYVAVVGDGAYAGLDGLTVYNLEQTLNTTVPGSSGVAGNTTAKARVGHAQFTVVGSKSGQTWVGIYSKDNADNQGTSGAAAAFGGYLDFVLDNLTIELAPAEKNELALLLQKADAMVESSYKATAASGKDDTAAWSEFVTARTNGHTVFDNDSATTEQVNNALTALQTAIGNMEKVSISISGTVKNTNNAPVAGVVLTLENETYFPVGLTVTTGEDGAFRFASKSGVELIPATYHIKAEATGYYVTTTGDIVVSKENGDVTKDITLDAEAPGAYVNDFNTGDISMMGPVVDEPKDQLPTTEWVEYNGSGALKVIWNGQGGQAARPINNVVDKTVSFANGTFSFDVTALTTGARFNVTMRTTSGSNRLTIGQEDTASKWFGEFWSEEGPTGYTGTQNNSGKPYVEPGATRNVRVTLDGTLATVYIDGMSVYSVNLIADNLTGSNVDAITTPGWCGINMSGNQGSEFIVDNIRIIRADAAEGVYNVAGQVVARSGVAVSGAAVELFDGDARVAGTTTNALGAYQISRVAPGSYTMKVSAPFFTAQDKTITISSANLTGQNFTLVPDISSLTALIEQVEALNEEEYTEETWADLQAALTEANKIDDTSSIAALNTAYRDLSNARDALVRKPLAAADFSALRELYNEMALVENNNYTNATWEAFQSALEAAYNIQLNGDATQEQVDKAKVDLEAANMALVKAADPASLDTTALQTAYDSAKNVEKGNASDAAWERFTAARDAALAILSNADGLTQDDVDAAATELTAAQSGLRSGGGGGGGSAPAETTTTETRDDGAKVTTVTKPDGSKVETVEQPDGAKSETVTAKDGSVTITATDPEGEELAKVEIPATIPAPETKFEDLAPTPWAEEAINNVAGLKLVNGIGDNKYDPITSMTRGSLATVLHRLSNGKTNYNVTFQDVTAGKYYTEGVAWAAKVGVVTGISTDVFAPDQVITREQLAVMLARYAKLIGLNTKADAKSLDQFADGDATGTWAVDGVAWCVENGILKGKGQNGLDPTANVTRAEVAVMLDRFIALIK